jgi:hypothetical protein
MVELIAQYPFILYLLLCLSILVFPLVAILGIVGFIQGREFSTPVFKVGARPGLVGSPGGTPGRTEGPISEAQLEDIAERVRARLDAYKEQEGLSDETLLFQPPELPDNTMSLFAMKTAIGRRIRELVLSHGGAWAGSSWASLETFLGHARNMNLLDDGLWEDVGSFEWVITPGIYGDEIGEEQFRDASQLGSKILRQLDEVEMGPMAMG